MSNLIVAQSHFDGFGPSVLSRQMRGSLVEQTIPTDRLEARKMLRDHCPYHPGVYGWLDKHRQLVYVGKSKSLRMRLLSYFARTPSDPKMLRIRQHGHQLVWETVSSELLALIREQELIYRWRPDFNKQGQPTRTQPAYLCLGNGAAPNAFLARRPSRRAAFSLGPISGTNRLRQSIEAINQVFQLRDCPDKTKIEFNDQPKLFENPQSAQCIRFELGSCPGPCAGLCSAKKYSDNVQRAVDFLQGRSESVFGEIETAMRIAAQSEGFERAAVLRDYLEDLQWLNRRLDILRTAEQKLNGILPVAAPRKQTGWMVLRGGRLVFTATRPDRPCRAKKARVKLEEIEVQPAYQANNLLEMNLQVIVMAWLRKNPEMANRLISFESAIEICTQKMV